MKTKRILIINIFTIALLGLVFNSCKKDKEEEEIDRDTSLASDNALVQNTFSNVKNIADEAYNSSKAGYKATCDDIIGGCATITFDTASNPRLLIIDFGEDNCLCGDNRYRRGKIKVSYTGPYREPGTVLTHTFENYFVNDNEVKGMKIVTNAGENANGNISFTIDVDGSIIKADGSGTITWISNRTREWIEGDSTLTWLDDIYLITGSGHGTSASGYSYQVDITNALRREIGCRYFVSGTFDLKPEGKYTRTVDYGNGECDNEITITINGITYIIILP
ncbi:MAG: hypothetical protein K8R58_00250 [Bacteroidales bacterium]|nr:hypothetical protein [Bacteroidales bacterium]